MNPFPLPSRRLLRTLLNAVALGFLAAPVPAQARGDSPVLEAVILPGWSNANGTRMAALHLRLSPGWHTYWRIPGEAGIAPLFDWSQSQNVASVAPIWPRPEVFDQNGYRSYGYEDELILPLEITPHDPARPMALMGELAIGVCRETCVPADVSVTGALRGEGGPDGRIQQALDSAARPGAPMGLTRTTCRLEPARRGAALTLRATLPRQGSTEHVIIEIPGSGYRVTESRSWREGGDLVTEAQLRAPRRAEVVGVDRASIAFTVLGEARMLWSQGCIGG